MEITIHYYQGYCIYYCAIIVINLFIPIQPKNKGVIYKDMLERENVFVHILQNLYLGKAVSNKLNYM